jgi:hypothetical protein
MPRFDSNESRLNRTIDRARGRDIESMFRILKPRFPGHGEERKEPETLADRRVRNGEIVSDKLLLAKFMCIHAVPYIFNGTKYGCKRCQPRS